MFHYDGNIIFQNIRFRLIVGASLQLLQLRPREIRFSERIQDFLAQVQIKLWAQEVALINRFTWVNSKFRNVIVMYIFITNGAKTYYV